MEAAHGEVISLGVDWITCTGTKETSAFNMLTLASDLVTFRLRGGFERKGWGMAGFVGVQALGVQYGIRDNEVIVRLSGDLAHLRWRGLYEMADNCTRIDFECTTRNGRSPDARVKGHYAEARRYGRGKKKTPTVTLIRSTAGGSTLYLGKRTSMKYGRIYNKAVESKLQQYEGCVRYELELKDRQALAQCARIASARYPSDTIAANLSAFFTSRGVPLRLIDKREALRKLSPIIPTHARSLEWLATQIRPTVRRLLDCGMVQEVFDSLQLTPTDFEEVLLRSRTSTA